MTAERCMLVGAACAYLLTLFLVRNRAIREKYALGWLLTATVGLVLGFFPDIPIRLASMVHMSNAALILYAAVAAGYLFGLSVSMSLSGLCRRNRRLTQEVALLEQRIRELERPRETEPAREHPAR